MAKEKKVGVCALCGKTMQITREHVPPKNLYLPPRPKNTITVPVCELCNHRYHLDDEYFRVYVAVGAIPGSRLWRLWNEKVVDSSFVRGGGLKGRLLFTQPTGEVGDFEEFVFRHEGIENSSSRWLMAFYKLHTFTVKVREPANEAMPPIVKRSG